MISTFEEITQELMRLLETGCADVDFVRSFPGNVTEFPVHRPTVSVGIANARLPLGEGIFLGIDHRKNSYFGATATVTYRLKICVPKDSYGSVAYETFDKIADALLLDSELYITSVSCADITFDRVMGALVLTAEIALKAELQTMIDAKEEPQ